MPIRQDQEPAVVGQELQAVIAVADPSVLIRDMDLHPSSGRVRHLLLVRIVLTGPRRTAG